ncbi:MAG: GNAT family N-acetyltransferase [Atopobiaceae bacterium]|nr:GNAT family N-acetyltransferase [Atopobiaceae bacterium]
MAVRIRHFKEEDFSQVAALLGDTWHSSDDEAARYWRGADQLAWHLSRSQTGFVACDGDDVRGVALVAMADAPTDPRWEAEKWRIAQLAWIQDGVDSQSDEGSEIIELEHALSQRLSEEHGAADAGVLELLVVDEGMRGTGVGARLMSEALHWLDLQGAERMRLITDDGCDWQIYDHLGMERVVSDATSEGFGVFAYEGAVDELRERLQH